MIFDILRFILFYSSLNLFYHKYLVFSDVLLIVIYLGKLLITLVNKYAPEEVVPAKKEALQGPAPIPGNIMAAITAAVNVVTLGKGKITKVEKL